MAINLYSKASVDSLLSPKLSISSLTNAAATTLNATAPTTDQVLSFDGTELKWATVSGGGGLTISDLSNGATSTLNATVPTTGQALTYDGTDLVWATVGGGSGTLTYSSPYIYDTATASNINVLDLTSGSLNASTVTGGNAQMDLVGLTLTASSGAVITFADGTTQSTAAVSGITDAPSDSKAYVRKDAAWLALVSDIPDFAWYDHPPAAYSTNVANSGVAAVASVNCHNLVTSASVANSRASVFTNKSTSFAGYVGQFYGNGAFAKYRLNWSKKIALFSAFNDAGNGIAANVDYWVAMGLPSGGAFVGTFTDKGIGIHINTTAANTAQIRIIYHDGTTQKASAWVNYNSVQSNNSFANNAWALYSDGTGTIKLFCYSNLQNGLVLTVNDGPTGIGSTNNNMNIGASILTGATPSSNTICMLQPRIYYGL